MAAVTLGLVGALRPTLTAFMADLQVRDSRGPRSHPEIQTPLRTFEADL